MMKTESETPDVDVPINAEKMRAALADIMECTDGLQYGDSFVTPFGRFQF